MTVQFIRTEGDAELVVLTRRDYDALLAQAGDEAAEDRVSRQLAAEAKAAIAAGEETVLPGWFVEAIAGQGNPFRALRNMRGKTQIDLAEAAGISQAYVSDLERGTKVPSIAVLDAISRALDLDPAWLRALERNRVVD